MERRDERRFPSFCRDRSSLRVNESYGFDEVSCSAMDRNLQTREREGSSVSNSQRDVGGKVIVTHDNFRYLSCSRMRVSGRVEGVREFDQ